MDWDEIDDGEENGLVNDGTDFLEPASPDLFDDPDGVEYEDWEFDFDPEGED